MDDRQRQDPETEATLATARRFLEAFGRHDVDGVMAAMAEDCVFENTWPPPDGERHDTGCHGPCERSAAHFVDPGDPGGAGVPGLSLETERRFRCGDHLRAWYVSAR